MVEELGFVGEGGCPGDGDLRFVLLLCWGACSYCEICSYPGFCYGYWGGDH